ncbi:MAG TPA: transcription antitermination factor NusB [Acidimicrobiales bacterium]
MPSARKVALDALERIEHHGAYANLVLPTLLGRSGLPERDRRFVTDLVYGTTRMRRACDFLVDRFLTKPPVDRVRSALRLGAYQLAYGGVAAHAAVAETVAVTPRSARGLVNAVLRRVADQPLGPDDWPDDATRLSVPDWVVERLTADLGRAQALAALATMNEPAEVVERPDGYVQDTASQLVTALVGAEAGERVLDLCAAPGGKATALAAAGARVVAADVRERRAGLVRANAERTGVGDRVAVVTADGTRPPWRAGSFDRVLVDAPCSGLGTLRRRADLRWRVEPASVDRLAALQRSLVAAAADLVRPGGTLVYSVCTLTVAESVEVDAWLRAERPDLTPLDPPGDPWAPWGSGALLLPQAADTDGMALFRYQRSP